MKRCTFGDVIRPEKAACLLLLSAFARLQAFMKVHPSSRDALWFTHLMRRRITQLWRQKHGRLILLAPVAVLLFTVVWTSSSPDGSIQSKSVTDSPAVTRTAAQTDQTSPGLSSATLSAARKASDSFTDTRQASDAQTGSQAAVEEEEEEEAKAPDLAKVMAEILEFPEDLDGPNNPALLGLVEPIDFDDTTQLQGMLSASSRLLRGPGRFKQNATRDHMIVAMPSDRSHLPLVEASRAWRKDIRAYVALNDTALAATHRNQTDAREIWGYYPDDWPLKGLHAGDTRAALTPFLAHQMYAGNYSWLLYGDDDTVFFIDSVSELLQDFDPSLPYLITDHYWWADKTDAEAHFHPHERAPRCLPCHWTQEDQERSLRADGYKPFVGYPACPCTAEHICRYDERGFFDEDCSMPVHPHRAYSIHGGAGAIMSIGLMERLPLSFMEDCMAEMSGTGGDAFLSRCVWKAGYAFTDPGYSFYHWEAKSFDPGPEASQKLVQDFSTALMGSCAEEPLEVISHIATSHVRAQQQGLTEATQITHTLAHIYDRWRQRVKSIISEARPQRSAVSESTLPSSSLRSRTHASGTGADFGDLNLIPKGLPKSAVYEVESDSGNALLAGNSAMSAAEARLQDVAAKQQALGLEAFQGADSGGNLFHAGGSSEGFLNLVGEDEDNLATQQQIEEEELKAATEEAAPGFDPNQEAARAAFVNSKSEEVEESRQISNTDLAGTDFDRLLEAASSGGKSDIQDSIPGGRLNGIDLQGATRRTNNTLNATATGMDRSGSGNPHTLTDTLQQLQQEQQRKADAAKASAKTKAGRTSAKDLPWSQLKAVAEESTAADDERQLLNRDPVSHASHGQLLGRSQNSNGLNQQTTEDNLDDASQSMTAFTG